MGTLANHELQAAAQLLSPIWVRDLELIENRVLSLNEHYAAERKRLSDQCPMTRYHSGLILEFRRHDYEHGWFPAASIRWVAGRLYVNIRKDLLRQKRAKAITRKCKTDGRWTQPTRRNISALFKKGTQPWEKDLTMKYEREARKLRTMLFYQQKTATRIKNYPQMPEFVSIWEDL